MPPKRRFGHTGVEAGSARVGCRGMGAVTDRAMRACAGGLCRQVLRVLCDLCVKRLGGRGRAKRRFFNAKIAKVREGRRTASVVRVVRRRTVVVHAAPTKKVRRQSEFSRRATRGSDMASAAAGRDCLCGMIDPVAKQKVVDQDVPNLSSLIIDSSEVGDHKRIRSEFSRSIQQLDLPSARERRKKTDRGIREDRSVVHLTSASDAPPTAQWS